MERSLTGNRSPAELAAARLKWTTVGEQQPAVRNCPKGRSSCTEPSVPFDADAMTVTLRPMDIRTFIVTFN